MGIRISDRCGALAGTAILRSSRLLRFACAVRPACLTGGGLAALALAIGCGAPQSATQSQARQAAASPTPLATVAAPPPKVEPNPTPTVTTDTCLTCHPHKKLLQATARYRTAGGVRVNPHVSIDPDSPKPHASGKGIADCTNCHEPHPIPPEGPKQKVKANLDYCFGACHHQRNFRRCSECH
jgi:hypothetical protein